MKYTEALAEIRNFLNGFLGSEPFKTATLTLNIIEQTKSGSSTVTTKKDYTVSDFCANKPVVRINDFLTKLTPLSEKISDYGNKLFNDPTSEYGERQHWYQLSGYASGFAKSGVFNTETLKTDVDSRYSQCRGLMYAVLEKMTDEEWIFRESKWEEMQSVFKALKAEYDSFEPPAYSSSFTGSASFSTGNEFLSHGNGTSFSFLGSFPGDFPLGSYDFDASAWNANPGNLGSSQTSRKFQRLVFSDWKQSCFWGDMDRYGKVRAIFDHALEAFPLMTTAVGNMADIIYEWKDLAIEASNTQSAASPLMNDGSQLGAFDGYSMTGVYKLSGDKFSDFDPVIGTAVKAWRESKDLEVENQNLNATSLSLDEIKEQLLSGEYKPFGNAQDAETIRSEFIDSKILQSIDFFGRGKSIYDRINTMMKKWKWIY
jgi:hypothetical protein